MKWNVTCKPSYSLLKVGLEPGETVTAEPGAMVYMKGDIEIKTSSGGILKGIMRSMLGGESFWLNTYRARSHAEIWFAPSLPGDIEALNIDGKGLIIQDTSYLAHHGDISIGTAWRGFRGLLAEGELFWLKAEGRGLVWVTSYGGLEKLELKPGERVIVDNFHFVAMDNSMKWRVRKFGGIKSFMFGGEGIVIEIEGPGRVILQTRSLLPFIERISRYIRS